MQQPRAGGAAESGCLAERCKVRITPEADQAVASQVTQHVAKLVQDDLIVELARLDLLDLRVPEAFQAHRRRACGFPPRLTPEWDQFPSASKVMRTSELRSAPVHMRGSLKLPKSKSIAP